MKRMNTSGLVFRTVDKTVGIMNVVFPDNTATCERLYSKSKTIFKFQL